jgi:hypothetical protein
LYGRGGDRRGDQFTHLAEPESFPPGLRAPGGLATTSVTVVKVPPGTLETITVVNWVGIVMTVSPSLFVVVNDTGVGTVETGSGDWSLSTDRVGVGSGSSFTVCPGPEEDEEEYDDEPELESGPDEDELEELGGGLELLIVELEISSPPPSGPELEEDAGEDDEEGGGVSEGVEEEDEGGGVETVEDGGGSVGEVTTVDEVLISSALPSVEELGIEMEMEIDMVGEVGRGVDILSLSDEGGGVGGGVNALLLLSGLLLLGGGGVSVSMKELVGLEVDIERESRS